MLQLSDRDWAEFRVGDLFNVKTGKAYNKNKIDVAEYGLRHISRATSNHGIDCYINLDSIDGIVTYEGNCVTVSSIPYTDGTCAFYQDKTFCCGVGVNIITHELMTPELGQFLCTCINHEVVGKYGMARSLSINMLKDEILNLPITSDGLPDYQFMHDYIAEREPDYSWATQCIEPNAEISLTDREWAEFKVGEIFDIRIARGNDKGNLTVGGDIPFIGRSNCNNGFQGYYDAPYITDGNCITLGMVGTFRAYWQENNFAASQNILTIRERNLNKYIALFICNIIEHAIEGKYSYGHSIKASTFKDTIINLPITQDGLPDYDFMERYIKSLPFSKVLEA